NLLIIPGFGRIVRNGNLYMIRFCLLKRNQNFLIFPYRQNFIGTQFHRNSKSVFFSYDIIQFWQWQTLYSHIEKSRDDQWRIQKIGVFQINRSCKKEYFFDLNQKRRPIFKEEYRRTGGGKTIKRIHFRILKI